MAKDDSLKRLGGGGWQTRDGRFTIQAGGGRWSVVDSERTDDLGLPLVRGPFGSLTEAKAALQEARLDAAASPLAQRLAEAKTRSGGSRTRRGTDDGRTEATVRRRRAGDGPATPPPPPEPLWMAALDADAKARAKRLIDALADLDIPDPEDVVREDVRGKVPVIARAVLVRRLSLLAAEAAGDGASDGRRETAAKLVGLVAEWLSSRGREPGARLALPG